jgi:hypothetical protein
MTQPRDGNRDLPLTGIFHSCFSPPPNGTSRFCLSSPRHRSHDLFCTQTPFRILLGTELTFADPFFARSSGFHSTPSFLSLLPTPPRLPLVLLPQKETRSSQIATTLLLFFEISAQGHIAFHPSCSEGLPFVVLSTQAYVLLGCPRQTNPLFPLLHQL